MNVEQQQAADRLRQEQGWGDRRIAAALGLTRKQVRGDRERRLRNQPKAPDALGPKILLYDIETCPSLVWVWNQWKTNVIATERDWSILCFAWRWLGTDQTGFCSVFQDPTFQPDNFTDLQVCQQLHRLFSEADCVVAHNGDKFDQRKSNARFLYWGLTPPSPYQQVDTKKEAQRYFANYSNALNELGRLLGIGQKQAHEGFALWRACMAGDPAAWARMEDYNVQDLELLEGLYLRLLPWIGSPGKGGGGPNRGLWPQPDDEDWTCPKCGSHRRRGVAPYRTRFSTYLSSCCADCGGWSRAPFRNKGHASAI